MMGHMMNNKAVLHWSPFVARVLLAILFLFAGFGKIMGFSMTVGYIASVGLPMPTVLAVLSIIIEVGGGLMLVSGFMARIAAKVLFFFTLLATIFFHNNFGDQMQVLMALKNLSIMGGLLMVFVHGPGPISMGCWCPKCNCGKCHICEGGECSQNHA